MKDTPRGDQKTLDGRNVSLGSPSHFVSAVRIF